MNVTREIATKVLKAANKAIRKMFEKNKLMIVGGAARFDHLSVRQSIKSRLMAGGKLVDRTKAKRVMAAVTAAVKPEIEKLGFKQVALGTTFARDGQTLNMRLTFGSINAASDEFERLCKQYKLDTKKLGFIRGTSYKLVGVQRRPRSLKVEIKRDYDGKIFVTDLQTAVSMFSKSNKPSKQTTLDGLINSMPDPDQARRELAFARRHMH